MQSKLIPNETRETEISSSALVQKVWNYCNVLRDDGISYGDYVEQLTYFLFLKMADEQSRPPLNKSSKIAKNLDWQSLLSKDGSLRFFIDTF
jgi:type I restriction enzyme M protein